MIAINRFMKKNRGSISIFLSIIMLSMFVMSGIIVEGSRIRQAEAIVQSASDSAAMSVIAKYDKELNDRYGLFVIDEETQKAMQDDYINFFMDNLSAQVPDEDSLSALFTRLEGELGLSAKVEESWDIYDFQPDKVDVKSLYSIGEPEILQLQTTEVAKYRSIFLMLNDIANKGSEISQSSEQQQKDVELMQDSLTYRDSAGGISGKLNQFSSDLREFYGENGSNLKDTYNTMASELEDSYKAINDAYYDMVSDYQNFKNEISNYNTKANEIRQEEEVLLSDKESIVFDAADENYDANAVNEWNNKKSAIDNKINDLKGILNNINTYKANYQTKLNSMNGYISTYQGKITVLENKVEEWIRKVNEFKTTYTSSLKPEVQRVLSETDSFVGQIDGSGASEGVADSCRKDAEYTKESLELALEPSIITNFDNTINYLGDIKNLINDFKSQYYNISIGDSSGANIVYLDDRGTIERLENDADTATANARHNDPSAEAVRAEWKNLSDIKIPDGDLPAITPGNFIGSGKNSYNSTVVSKLNAIKNKNNIPSDHYKYKCKEYSDDVKNKACGSDGNGGLVEFYNSHKNDVKQDDDDEEGNEIDDELFDRLPSKILGRNYEGAEDSGIKQEDEQYYNYVISRYKQASGPQVITSSASGIESGDESTINALTDVRFGEDKNSQNALMGGLGSFLDGVKNFFTEKQYDIMTYTYTMSMFKSRLTKSTDHWRDIYNNQNYTGKKFYSERDKEADKDLMLRDKSDSDKVVSVLNCELEYILHGQKTDKSNRNRVWATIYGTRLVNNVIAMYSNDEIRETSSAAANAIAAAIAAVTFGAGEVLAPLIQFAIIAVLAAIETYMDMNFLVNKGHKIPFIKTSDNLNISLDNLERADEDAANTPNYSDYDFMIKYEDYLLIFMLFTNQGTVLKRTADLIQMNMEKIKGEEYNVLKKYTYVRCYNETSIKPLVISYNFMPDDIHRKDRFILKTAVYEGY